MREFVRRLLVPIACFALVLAAGYPVLVSALPASLEAAGTGLALLAVATVLGRGAAVQPQRTTAAAVISPFVQPGPARRSEEAHRVA